MCRLEGQVHTALPICLHGPVDKMLACWALSWQGCGRNSQVHLAWHPHRKAQVSSDPGAMGPLGWPGHSRAVKQAVSPHLPHTVGKVQRVICLVSWELSWLGLCLPCLIWSLGSAVSQNGLTSCLPVSGAICARAVAQPGQALDSRDLWRCTAPTPVLPLHLLLSLPTKLISFSHSAVHSGIHTVHVSFVF